MSGNRRILSVQLLVLLGIAGLGTGFESAGQAGEKLANGIVLPDDWPPKPAELSREPLPEPPYLRMPPDIIPIDLGRQLLVDDFLVESTTLTRTHHLPQYHPANPVLSPDKPWEGEGSSARAAPFSDGVWFDPADGLCKLWYWAGSRTADRTRTSTCLATSRDGIHWDKPSLDVVPGTNIVLEDEPGCRRNSSTVWMDLIERDPQRRFKMFRVVQQSRKAGSPPAPPNHIRVGFSPDGVHWKTATESDECGDRSTVFYNGLRNVWVYGLRESGKEVSRCRGYYEAADVLSGARWDDRRRATGRPLWIGADRLDPDRSDLVLRRVPERPWDLVPSQLYNLDCVAYESLLLGLFSIWRGHPAVERPKINEVCVGFSRDGYHWSRPDRRAFCGVSEKKEDWNWGNVQSAGGCCQIWGDQLHFYVGGASGRPGASRTDPSRTGLATLRRDGFTSLDAGGEGGMLTTRKLLFTGRRLFVNVAADKGQLRVEVLDPSGKPIAPFTQDNCIPITADSTIQAVQWRGVEDLRAVAGRPIRFRFHLRRGELYAFWVSASASGASGGFVAAGGPGFTGPTDTVEVTAKRP